MALLDDSTPRPEQRLEIRCPNRTLRKAQVLSPNGEIQYILDTNSVTSWGLRRLLTDRNGLLVMQSRHISWPSLSKWTIEDHQCREICTVRDATQHRSGLTTLHVMRDGQQYMTMQSSDHAGTRTTMTDSQGQVVAEVMLTDNNDILFLGRRGLYRSVWSLHVYEGFDVPLIVILSYCRVEFHHMWRR